MWQLHLLMICIKCVHLLLLLYLLLVSCAAIIKYSIWMQIQIQQWIIFNSYFNYAKVLLFLLEHLSYVCGWRCTLEFEFVSRKIDPTSLKTPANAVQKKKSLWISAYRPGCSLLNSLKKQSHQKAIWLRLGALLIKHS